MMGRVKDFLVHELSLRPARLMRYLRRNFRDLLIARLGLKLGSLVLAVLLWHAISSRDVFEFNVPLIINGPEEVYLKSPPDRVRIKVQGPVEEIEYLRRNYQRVRALFNLHRKLGTEPIQTIQVDSRSELDFELLSPFLQIVDAVPKDISFQAERLVEKFIRVKPLLQGKVADGFELVETIEVDPAEVLVRGRASLMSRITILRTRPISIQGRRTTDDRLSAHLDLHHVPYLGSEHSPGSLSAEQNLVKVHLIIRHVLLEKSFEKLEIGVLSPSGYPFRTHLNQPTVNVTVEGIAPVLKYFDPGEIRVFVDVSALRESGTYMVAPVIKLPEGVTLATPLERVSVKIEEPSELP